MGGVVSGNRSSAAEISSARRGFFRPNAARTGLRGLDPPVQIPFLNATTPGYFSLGDHMRTGAPGPIVVASKTVPQKKKQNNSFLRQRISDLVNRSLDDDFRRHWGFGPLGLFFLLELRWVFLPAFCSVVLPGWLSILYFRSIIRVSRNSRYSSFQRSWIIRIGATLKNNCRVRPVFRERIKLASPKTRKCFITAMRLVSKCSHTSFTEHPGDFFTRSIMCRRAG